MLTGHEFDRPLERPLDMGLWRDRHLGLGLRVPALCVGYRMWLSGRILLEPSMNLAEPNWLGTWYRHYGFHGYA